MLAKYAALADTIWTMNIRKTYTHALLAKLLQIMVIEMAKLLMPQYAHLIRMSEKNSRRLGNKV